LANEDKWVETWRKKERVAVYASCNRIALLMGMNSSGETLITFEYTEDATTFHSLPDFPTLDKRIAGAALLNGGDMFVATPDKSCFLYENEKSAWKRCPDMKGYVSQKATFGVVKKEGGEVEIVLVQHSTVNIFSIKELRWRTGAGMVEKDIQQMEFVRVDYYL
jgi:hypothetical protein